jgi:hypothetical protein
MHQRHRPATATPAHLPARPAGHRARHRRSCKSKTHVRIAAVGDSNRGCHLLLPRSDRHGTACQSPVPPGGARSRGTAARPAVASSESTVETWSRAIASVLAVEEFTTPTRPERVIKRPMRSATSCQRDRPPRHRSMVLRAGQAPCWSRPTGRSIGRFTLLFPPPRGEE